MMLRLAQRLAAIEAEGLGRQMLSLSPRQAPWVEVNGRPALNLASNDYLGLQHHPALAAAAARAATEQGTGAGAARLVTGTMELHARLEEALAELLQVERALLFGSGYLAHLGSIPALAGEGDAIYSDERNHASIVDGCRLSRARVRVFRHRDVDHLASLLEEDRGHGGQRLVVTETIFSMDGDEAPLGAICDLAERHGAWVMVDEAHAFGIRGASGAGLVTELGLADRVQVRMGTLGKAAGSYGAFVGGAAILVQYLIHRARSFVYSTALPPPVVAASLAALEIIGGPEGDRLRRDLRRANRGVREGLLSQGWCLDGVSGPILPLQVGDPGRAVALSERLLEAGLLVRAMRYPTVPRGADRLRVVVSAPLSPGHVETALAAFREIARDVRP
jgi:8-amino-7-oxononanoate synthase